MRMPRLQHLTLFSFAAVLLLLFSICCPVSGRIYRTNDAVVIEVDDVRPSTLSNRNFGNPRPIPMMYAVNPYTGLSYQQQQPNFPFWPYPHLYQPASSTSGVEKVTANSHQSRQQKITCGVGPPSPPQRIVGGTNATPNSWPFIVMISRMCAGSILSPTRILTAAHCVNELSAMDILSLTVSLGMHNLTANDQQMTRRVTRVVYHTSYNSKTKQNDVAILTVEPPIVYSSAISPVCLPAASSAVDQFAGKNAAIMGWGDLSFVFTLDGKTASVLQQATVQITPNAYCNAQYGDGITNQQLCASAPGKDTCRYDDGGPIVVQAKTAGSTLAWTQVGITSFRHGCADPNFAGVYASVAFFRKWIDTYMTS